MKANFVFDNVTAFDIVKADVLLGQTFKVNLEDGPEIVWRPSNDPVLALVESPDSATITATGVGTSEIWLTNGEVIEKKLLITVYSNQASDLGLSSGKSVPKTK